jgi:hypothetical protein
MLHEEPSDSIAKLISVLYITFLAFVFLKRTQWQCILGYDNSTAMYKLQKTLHPVGIRTRDLLFCRRTWWPLCHTDRATLYYFVFIVTWKIFCNLLILWLFQLCFFMFFNVGLYFENLKSICHICPSRSSVSWGSWLQGCQIGTW